ncbi:hypothetical protein CK203_090073 [Vitis vinifera]|uniref:DUF659 domain-containing protein n=1 Tax=Vitis vinifera TaxID=29760 RepID=A0A438E5X3_VITVI|nr:hypothetical protein CK203_090073 [Vitis vinifera]
MYSKGLPFNTVNDPYWFSMIDAVANFGPRFKPPSMHELRTWILKEEVNDLMVEEIGEENVVQVITDNASNYVNVGMRLMEKRSRLWWTPCAAHCIDLMLEDIGKLNVHATTLSRARQVVKFIYGHTWVLSLMRTFTKNHELIRPAITRFATAFLTLQSLYKQKQALIAMFSLEKWCSSTWTTVPLVSVLREVDSKERPTMGYIYELMDSAKEKIAFNCRGMERKYGPIWRKIDARWTPQLHRPLYAADYYLNPHCGMEISSLMLMSRIVIDSRTLRSPTSWWMRFGVQHRSCKSLLFESLALLVVLQDVKEIGAHLNRYNTRLRERSLQRKQNVDPILVEEIDSDDEWIAEKEDPLLPLIFVGFKIMNYSMLMPLELCHPTPKRRKHHRIIWFLHIPTKGNIMKYQVSTSGGKGKEKELNLTPIDEDEDLDEWGYMIVDIFLLLIHWMRMMMTLERRI